MPIGGEIPYIRTGNDEILNRVRNNLVAIRGSYIYDRDLGENINDVDREAPDMLRQLTAKAREALDLVPEAEVTEVTYPEGIVKVKVLVGGEEHIITVGGIING